LGIPHAPSGWGIIAPAMLALPPLTMSIIPCRSRASVIARRSCSSSNGGLLRLTSRLVLTPVGTSWQVALGERAMASPMSGTVTSPTKVRSNSFAPKARMRAERLPMMLNSTPSRYGRPGFQ